MSKRQSSTAWSRRKTTTRARVNSRSRSRRTILLRLSDKETASVPAAVSRRVSQGHGNTQDPWDRESVAVPFWNNKLPDNSLIFFCFLRLKESKPWKMWGLRPNRPGSLLAPCLVTGILLIWAGFEGFDGPLRILPCIYPCFCKSFYKLTRPLPRVVLLTPSFRACYIRMVLRVSLVLLER